ncbi:threonine synthase [Slackia heliotrinireducens]|uniref:Threonine synthase n=1 Tax=Slackia heliotrinireducens (strain ATCC 29202 / DSM 20476 / NCTC 11029 / RHS 1) TaxID=471855 RepID=C7N6U1_SLAHD|nr:threonine synthase [Slackia heliotrinireducens]ACV22626.1 L-threonine synthase [Slackia heliotrinireducens DSM 20476]VEH01160.1 Threonine synthase [Slackia heliotrinireducens]
MASIYHSTRGTDQVCGAKEAVLNGIAPDGGLYVTDALGSAALDLNKVVGQTFQQIAADVLATLLDDYTREEIESCVDAAYVGTFDAPEVTPLVPVEDQYVLELFHGPTSAFKDVALQMLPQLMSRATGEQHIMILTATSGDTGKAALAGFANTPGLGISVFFPHGGTSAIQRLQMVTQPGDNVAVAAVRGNFDDTQSTVKAIFADKELAARLAEKNIVLSSANSINVGRLAPQVTYYFDAYAQLVRAGKINVGDEVEFCVPTGNFGDVLAGYFAKNMGLPVAKLIVASNANNILTDFLTTGVYDRNRPFHKTISPSMDILISSNLERLLYYASKGDTAYVAQLMADLKETGRYEVREDILAGIRELFDCGCADDDMARESMAECYKQTGYVLDPHTAVGWNVSKRIPCKAAARVVLSTASPFKFCRDVCDALGFNAEGSDFDCLRELEKQTGLAAPAALAALESADVRFEDVIAKDEMPAFVEAKCGELL